jgi:peptidyl-prolyl cis-trans isomerase B (cyclophilin B)
MNMRTTILIIVAVLCIGLLALLIFRFGPPGELTNTNATVAHSTNNQNSMTTNDQQLEKLASTPTVRITTSYGPIAIRLYTADAPELTKNFIELARSGYYNGVSIHRIVPGFVIQGGDPSGTGAGGHSYQGEGTGLADETGALALKHLKGSVAWAKSSLPNSIGSQFYIALDALPQLDGSYSVIGQVVDGMDAVEKIAAVPTDAQSRPVEPVVMTSVVVEE